MSQRVRFWAFIIVALSAMSIQSCVEAERSYTKLAPGIYRASLFLEGRPIVNDDDDDLSIEQMTIDGELPFNFEVEYITEDSFQIVIQNGEERIMVNNIEYGWDKSTARDTIVINFPVYDTKIRAIYHENVMEGEWIVNYRPNYSIPFVAYHGQGHRFESRQMPANHDISGEWKCTFDPDSDDAYPAIALFDQDEKTLTGTFKTETGDYRYLEGLIEGDKFGLSCFDGAHAFLFEGKVVQDEIIGSFRSGKHYKTTWTGERNEGYQLTKASELSQSTSENAISFSFPNTAGEMISLNDQIYQNKVKLVKIMGTWCPNCRDQTVFLKEYMADNPSEHYELITIGFERYKDEAKNIEALKRYKTQYDLDHDILLGGFYNKGQASEKLPFLDKVISYPTLIFVDKDNIIRYIHTGFAGPATDEYDSFATEFDQILQGLIAEI